MKTHLTYTGASAGKPICGAPRGEHNLHACMTPLHRDEIRNACCKACVATWLAYAFDGDPLPSYPCTLDEIEAIEREIPQEFASDEEVTAFRVKLKERTKHLRKTTNPNQVNQ